MTNVCVSADVGQESEKGEDDEWESQQIRKGVSGAQVRWSCHCAVFLKSHIVCDWFCVEFVVDSMALGQVFLRVIWIYF